MDGTPCRGVVEIIQSGRSEMCVIDPRNTTDIILTKGLRQAVPGSQDINVHARAWSGTMHTLLSVCKDADYCRVWWISQKGAELAKCGFREYSKRVTQIQFGNTFYASPPNMYAFPVSRQSSSSFPLAYASGPSPPPHTFQNKAPTLTSKAPTLTFQVDDVTAATSGNTSSDVRDTPDTPSGGRVTRRRLTTLSTLCDFDTGTYVRPRRARAEMREVPVPPHDPWGPSPLHPTEGEACASPEPWTAEPTALPRPQVPEPPSLAYAAWLAWPERDTSPAWTAVTPTGGDVTVTAWPDGALSSLSEPCVTVRAGDGAWGLPWLTLVTETAVGPLAGAVLKVTATGRPRAPSAGAGYQRGRDVRGGGATKGGV